MSENKTQISDVSPAQFIAEVESPTRQADAEVLMAMMTKISGFEPRMWGPTIVGFGSYHYKYDSGREGDYLITGFSPRKANLTVYVIPGFDDMSDDLHSLGKHRIGKGCLYINKLADVDLDVLAKIVTSSVVKMQATYG